ncbi:MAG TPA: hypothetical protein VIT67_07075, partial [Povalibacter sp.]
EFCDVVAGAARGRSSDREVTIFDSVGFALEDFSALRYVHQLHRRQTGLHAELDLVPQLNDPKNLFGDLVASATDRRRTSHRSRPRATSEISA